MFSMTKSMELDEVQTLFNFVNRRHCGEDVKFGIILHLHQNALENSGLYFCIT